MVENHLITYLKTFMEIVIKTNLRIHLNLYTISKITTTINQRMTAVTCKDMEKKEHVFLLITV